MIYEVVTKKEMKLKDGNKLYEIQGFVSSADIDKQIAITYSTSDVDVGSKYNATLVVGKDLKTCKIRLKDKIVR